MPALAMIQPYMLMKLVIGTEELFACLQVILEQSFCARARSRDIDENAAAHCGQL